MNDKNYMPLGFGNTSLNVLNPGRSVIIDMIMVQFISVIVVMLMILIFKGQELSSSVLSYYLVGLKNHSWWLISTCEEDKLNF